MNRRRLLATMALLGSGTLLFEVLLTRMMAIALFANLAFGAIAIALSGFAVGGWIASGHEMLDGRTQLRRIRVSLLVAATASLVALLALVAIPLVPEEIGSAGKVAATWATRWRAVRNDPFQLNWPSIALVVALQAVPFAATAYAQGLMLAREPGRAGIVYAADLVGACLGSWGGLAMLPALGAENSVAVVMILFALAAAAVPAPVFGISRAATAILLAVALALLLFHPLEMRHAAGFSEARIIDTAWSSLARVGLYDKGVQSGDEEAEPAVGGDEMYVVVDNASRSRVAFLRDNRFENNLSRVAFTLRPRGSVLVIGAGGGQEIVDALETATPGVTRRIDAIEVAGGIPRLLRRHFGNDPRFLLDQPGVSYQVADGRSYVETSRRRWAVIQMKEVNLHTLAGQASVSWSPSLLFTKEAFATYFQHLDQDGLLSMEKFYRAREVNSFKHLLSTLRAAAEDAGMDLGSRTVVVDRKYSYGWRRLVLVSRSPLEPSDIAEIGSYTRSHGQEVFRSPRQPAADREVEEIVAGSVSVAAAAAYARDGVVLDPTDDDRPFGHQHVEYLAALGGAAGGRENETEVRNQIANFQALTVIVGAFATICLGLLAVFVRRARKAQRRAAWRYLILFAALGFGFMLLEIVLVERASLLLGHPTFGFVSVLTALLLALSLGSAISNLIVDASRPRLAGAIAVAAALVGVGLVPVLLPSLLPAFRGETPLVVRAVVVSGMVFAGAISLGVFLPSAIRAVGESGVVPVSSCWAVNGATSVLGTVSAALLVRTVGFSATAHVALIVYLGAATLWMGVVGARRTSA